jgi:hypothetical protein
MSVALKIIVTVCNRHLNCTKLIYKIVQSLAAHQLRLAISDYTQQLHPEQRLIKRIRITIAIHRYTIMESVE